MQSVYENCLDLGPSLCDASGLLGYPGAFNLLQDVATAHAERLGVGLAAMAARSLFWLTVRTRIVFDARPAMSTPVTLRTWPEKPGPLRCNRSYELAQGGQPLIRARTEWAVFNSSTHSIQPGAELFPADLSFGAAALAEPYARIPDRFEGLEPFAAYTVRSTDIDVGGHMNNAAYLRALFGCFSTRELAGMEIRTIDVSFRASCFEGEVLRFTRREHDGALDIRAARGEDTVLLVRIEP